MAFEQAAEIAAAAGAAALVPRCLVSLAQHATIRGDTGKALALVERARPLAEECGDGEALLGIACEESFQHLCSGRTETALDAALAGLQTARLLGLQDSLPAVVLTANAFAVLVNTGQTTAAGELVDPLTDGAPDRQHVYTHLCRVEVDILRGELDAAQRRLQEVQAITVGRQGGFRAQDYAPLLAADLALWTGHPGEALAEAARELPLLGPPIMGVAGQWLIAGMRACADLAESARACRDDAAEADALAAAADLVSWEGRLLVGPFTASPGGRVRARGARGLAG